VRRVPGARYAELQARYERMAAAHEAAEKLADERQTVITRQEKTITRLRDEQPGPLVREPQPSVGDHELRRQLHLSQRAQTELAEQLAVVQRAHEADTRELHDLRQGVTK